MTRRPRRYLLAVAAAVLVALVGGLPWGPRAASAEISDKAGELYSIEKRDLMGSHEIMLSLGALPIDAFATGMTLHGSYTYHFSQLIGWEIIGGMWSFNFGTGLKEELKDRFNVQPTDVGELQWIINSNFVFKPMYGKFALINSRLFTGELFFVGGYALGGYTAAIPSGVDVGFCVRMFLGQYFSLRLDLREYLFFPGFSSVEDNLWVSLGLALTFGFDDPKRDESVLDKESP